MPPDKAKARNKSFEQFSTEVRDSCEKYAQRKGYIPGDVDGANPMADFKKKMGIATGHNMGEILSKWMEYLKNPRRVLLVKICGWAFIEWRECDSE